MAFGYAGKAEIEKKWLSVSAETVGEQLFSLSAGQNRIHRGFGAGHFENRHDLIQEVVENSLIAKEGLISVYFKIPKR